MIRLILIAAFAVLSLMGPAMADEDVSIRGNFPQLLARGETTPQMANRIAVLLINLDRLIAPECGMKRVFEFAGADHVDVSDLSVKVDPALPGVWRFAIVANGCWAPRTHNVFVTPRGAAPATLRLGVPGRTVAGLRYQPDAIQLVLREANGIAMRGNCQDRAFISDSQAPRARQVGKPWTEFWTATACEVTRKFAVMFTPEGARMRIAVASSE